ncbi:DNA ligase [bacterium]|jgi:DNA ligase D-like protein (predicted 3'-phosphoesterase)|nr:DNA ligase [bacterium]MBT5015414.1 DNA ligase [bacterium]
MPKLKKYVERRDLSKSKEPKAVVKLKGSKQIFVIQKHEASHLHYDFRLEIDGVLVSWAVPKGPSTNPADKRLAVRTDDHPMDYAKFEGIIPEGNYGGGTVMVWDYGIYKNIKVKDGKLVPMKQCLKNGQIEVWLDGHKLKGGYALIKTKFGSSGDNWLLVKMRDDEADARRNPVSTQNKSALTDRTMTEIKKAQ